MAKHLVEFPLEDGSSIVVEVDEPEGGTVRVARPGDIAEKAQQTFEQAMSGIRPAAESIIDRLRSLSDPPDQVNVEFALKLGGRVGAIIASTAGEANFKVTLSWRRTEQRGG